MTARGEMLHSVTLSGLPNHARMIGKERGSTAFRRFFLSRLEPQSIVPIKLKIIDSFALKLAMMQDIEYELSRVVDLAILGVYTSIKNAYFRPIEMA